MNGGTHIGERLRELRGARTQREIVERMAALGDPVTDAAVSLWERSGKIARKHVPAYDEALDAGGEALELLGHTPGGESLLTDLAAKLGGLADINAKLDLILSKMDEIATRGHVASAGKAVEKLAETLSTALVPDVPKRSAKRASARR